MPLFSGFTYTAVGGVIARVIGVFKLRFAPYPPLMVTFLLVSAIYVNFYAHPFLADMWPS